MEVLDQKGAGSPETPRFDDGMVNVGELIRAMAEPPVNETMDTQAEPNALTHHDFSYEHHRRLRTNNVQERGNRELKRRSRVVQVFP